MWKIALAFAVFAAIALFVIFKAGDQVDMSGEKHGVEASQAPAAGASAAGPVPTASATKP
ncbi:hypothetical protein EZ313_11625 [Ramlibacter henchirensis]|uniref:Uncharacterized protein n=1 Tax=Ramlibacter henchirensis TaxID=204072 RepID=A0A4Z0C8K1_9BURK|nr:hypothetical protein [Ramlibacter henchirensis]TFZ07222.1 hypothetical protein EZ313_11625 [Ramlibacter henchirensis]